MSEIHVHGVSGQRLDPETLELLAGCVLVVAGERLARLLPDDAPPRMPVTPVREMVDAVRTAMATGPVMVLASGDPLFYGIGRTLLRHFAPAQLVFRPALSAMQLACARFRLPWDGLTMLSLHGRDPEGAAARILTSRKVLLFTDPGNTPDRIATSLLDLLDALDARERQRSIRVRVAENLGLEDERIVEGNLQEIGGMRFAPLNMMLVEQSGPHPEPPCLGLTEAELVHRRGLITKNEIRAVIMHCLRLPEQGVFWDVGGGSGSIAVEAAGIAPRSRIFTVERNSSRWDDIMANIRKFGRYQVRLVRGEAPEVLETLPDPDRIFVGGSGGRLADILRSCAARLRPEGRLVVSAVLAETARLAPERMRESGLSVESRIVRVERRDENGNGLRLNPITIITGKR